MSDYEVCIAEVLNTNKYYYCYLNGSVMKGFKKLTLLV